MRTANKLTWVVCLLFPVFVQAQPQVPPSFSFCGVELRLTSGARARVQDQINKIHASPAHFNEMVQRAQIYLPFVREGFEDQGVPVDLIYMTIQESALKGDAVSSSQAVGFWQFKEGAGKEMGLLINRQVDERKHIFRASQASAAYLAKINLDFNNWLYAVLAYYEGPTGAIPHTDPQYYGARSMTLDRDFHWYVLKVIAHKLAYAPYVEGPALTPFYLQPFSTRGETQVEALFRAHDLDPETFFAFNPWIEDRRFLPGGYEFTYYVPTPSEAYAGHLPDPNKGGPILQTAPTQPISDLTRLLPAGEEVWAEVPPPDAGELSSASGHGAPQHTRPSGGLDRLKDRGNDLDKDLPAEKQSSVIHVALPLATAPSDFIQIPLEEDPGYRDLYMLYHGRHTLEYLADDLDLSVKKLRHWNGLKSHQNPQPGQILYLQPPKKTPFHLVEQGESLIEIARRYKKSIRQLQKKNRMEISDLSIYEGQKLFVKKKKGKKALAEILVWEALLPAKPAPIGVEESYQEEGVDEGFAPTPEPSLPPAAPGLSGPGTQQPEEVWKIETVWVEHLVGNGETLWSISRMYGTKVGIIQRINGLNPDQGISPGQTLRILARKSLLDQLSRP